VTIEIEKASSAAAFVYQRRRKSNQHRKRRRGSIKALSKYGVISSVA